MIYKQEGIRGFFRGFGATLLAYAPASAVWWATYERCKAIFSEQLFTDKTGDLIVVDQHRSAQVTVFLSKRKTETRHTGDGRSSGRMDHSYCYQSNGCREDQTSDSTSPTLF